MSEEVYGFDIPVPAIDEEFDVALIGTKGKWYDHKVSVKNPVKSDDTDAKKDDKENKDADSKADDTDKDAKDSKTSEGKTLADLNLEDGDYTMDVTLTGGSGRATIDSPAAINVEGDKATATIVWSSPNYDYMLVDGEKYEPVNKDGNSTFEIPVSVFDAEMEVTVSVVGSRTSAPSFCASSAFPTKRFTIFLEARLTWIVILPSFTVRVPFPSFASFTWNIPLSVSNSAV